MSQQVPCLLHSDEQVVLTGACGEANTVTLPDARIFRKGFLSMQFVGCEMTHVDMMRTVKIVRIDFSIMFAIIK